MRQHDNPRDFRIQACAHCKYNADLDRLLDLRATVKEQLGQCRPCERDISIHFQPVPLLAGDALRAGGCQASDETISGNSGRSTGACRRTGVKKDLEGALSPVQADGIALEQRLDKFAELGDAEYKAFIMGYGL